MSQKKFITYDNLLTFNQKVQKKIALLQDKIDTIYNRTTVSYNLGNLDSSHDFYITKLWGGLYERTLHVTVLDKNNVNDLAVEDDIKNQLRYYLVKSNDSWFYMIKIPCVDERSEITLETDTGGVLGVVYDRNGTVLIVLSHINSYPSEATLTVYNANKSRIEENPST